MDLNIGDVRKDNVGCLLPVGIFIRLQLFGLFFATHTLYHLLKINIATYKKKHMFFFVYCYIILYLLGDALKLYCD